MKELKIIQDENGIVTTEATGLNFHEIIGLLEVTKAQAINNCIQLNSATKIVETLNPTK